MTELAVVSTGALERVVATARRMEQHEEVDRWDFADDVHEAINDERGPETVSGPRQGNQHSMSGFYRAVDKVNDSLRKAQVTSVGRSSIVGAYATAEAWPEEDRVEGANYWAHYELRGRDYTNRKQVLERLVEKTDGPVGTPRVRLWKSDQKHEKTVPFLDQVERGVRGFLKRKGNPWDRVADDDRQQIARMLRAVAAEIAAGEFGR